MTVMIDFDSAKRERLREAYLDAKRAGAKCFRFEGEDYVTDYAKYLIEYLDEVLVTVH